MRGTWYHLRVHNAAESRGNTLNALAPRRHNRTVLAPDDNGYLRADIPDAARPKLRLIREGEHRAERPLRLTKQIRQSRGVARAHHPLRDTAQPRYIRSYGLQER